MKRLILLFCILDSVPSVVVVLPNLLPAPTVPVHWRSGMKVWLDAGFMFLTWRKKKKTLHGWCSVFPLTVRHVAQQGLFLFLGWSHVRVQMLSARFQQPLVSAAWIRCRRRVQGTEPHVFPTSHPWFILAYCLWVWKELSSSLMQRTCAWGTDSLSWEIVVRGATVSIISSRRDNDANEPTKVLWHLLCKKLELSWVSSTC